MIIPRPWLKPAFCLTLVAVAFSLVPLRADDAPKTIDVKALNVREQDVVVPVPSEIFNALDKLGGSLNWAGEVSKEGNSRTTSRPQLALLLGTVIANGFIAVQAHDGAKVKDVGRRVLDLSKALGVQGPVLSHCQSIIDAADKENWPGVRVELDKAQKSVRSAMEQLQDQEASELVSIGGWLRGTQSLTSLVKQNYTPERAELLHQPELLDTFDRQLRGMKSKMIVSSPLIHDLRNGLEKIRPLVTVGGVDPIPESSVQQINATTNGLVKAIAP